MYKLLISFLIFVVVFGQKNLGDYCRAGDQLGECKLYKHCPIANENLQKLGIFPKICRFQKREPIICCLKKPGDISKEKCKEYSKYYLMTEILPVALLNPPVTTKDVCGHTVVQLIIGGTLASRREFPHMAAIGFQNTSSKIKWRCGGSIISERYILTAAHCLTSLDEGEPKFIRVGVTNLKNSNHNQTVEIEKLIAHPEYKFSSFYNDIALIKLKKNINLNSYARPACLYTESEILAKKAIATGWGVTEFGGELSEDLMKVVFNLIDNNECNPSYLKLSLRKLSKGIEKSSQLCAGADLTEIKDTCVGDSGGPLQIYHSGDDVKCMYDLVGITSFGKGCGSSSGVYTRISNYIRWIEEKVWLADLKNNLT